MKEELKHYQAVNQSKSRKELAEVILQIGGKKGKIGDHDAQTVATNLLNTPQVSWVYLPLAYGIRQQAMYLYTEAK